MDVVYCTDDNYVMPSGISMISLLENNRDDNFIIHVVGLNLKDESKDQLRLNIKEYKNAEIKFYEISQDLFETYNLSLFDSKYLSIAAYSRLFLTDILPATIDKILYLDCDVIITENISELFNTDINDYSVAGVVDLNLNKDDTFTRLGYDRQYGYINSGVVLINFKYWRENDVLKLFIDYYKDRMDKIKSHDQDIINGVFHDTKLLLPIKFNVNDYYYQRKRKVHVEYEKEIEVAIKKPSIIHFTSTYKPWDKGCLHPLQNEFEKCQAMSVWANIPKYWSKKVTFKYKTRYYKRVVLYALNLQKRKYLIREEL